VVAALGDEVELAADGLLSIDELLFIDEPPELELWVCWEFAGGSVLGLDCANAPESANALSAVPIMSFFSIGPPNSFGWCFGTTCVVL
jgi:hypothetical protein